MRELSSVDGLVVSQNKEWAEILTGYEARNKYVVLDAAGNELYFAAEEKGSVVLRIFLRALRPFEISVLKASGERVLQLKRPFKFYFHELDVFDAKGTLVGSIRRRFAFFRRLYTVVDDSGREVFELFGPILHPWTFEIRRDGGACGKITKKWSGVLKEGFTDADNFGVTFPGDCETGLKGLLLGAVFLIDFVHFENKPNNR